MSRPNRGLIIKKANTVLGGMVLQIGDEFDPIELGVPNHKVGLFFRGRYIEYGEIQRTHEEIIKSHREALEEKEAPRIAAENPENLECPVGGTFGADFDEYEECEGCGVFGACESAHAELRPEGESGKNGGENDPIAVISSRGGGWYDVEVDGSPINQKALKKEAAEKLKEEYNNG